MNKIKEELLKIIEGIYTDGIIKGSNSTANKNFTNSHHALNCIIEAIETHLLEYKSLPTLISYDSFDKLPIDRRICRDWGYNLAKKDIKVKLGLISNKREENE